MVFTGKMTHPQHRSTEGSQPAVNIGLQSHWDHSYSGNDVSAAYKVVSSYSNFGLFLAVCVAFSALTLLVGWQKKHPACKKPWGLWGRC